VDLQAPSPEAASSRRYTLEHDRIGAGNGMRITWKQTTTMIDKHKPDNTHGKITYG
jgi:hypothetical protein